MRMCEAHWAQLRSAIEARGLGHLVSANGRELASRFASALEGEDELANYDPLMWAYLLIVEEATNWCGLSLYMEDDLCPLCEVLKVYPPIPEGHRYATNDSYFVDGPADAVLEFAREHGIAEPFTLEQLSNEPTQGD